MCQVDERADNVVGVLMGTPNGSTVAGGVAANTPPRPADGGFYTEEV